MSKPTAPARADRRAARALQQLADTAPRRRWSPLATVGLAAVLVIALSIGVLCMLSR